MKNKRSGHLPGFTLIELLTVIGIIIVVFSISFQGLMQSQASQLFNTNFAKVYSMLNSARSQAITGRGQGDYTDFDNDMKFNYSTPSDVVTPANYGVYFDAGATTNNVVLFADIHPPIFGAQGAEKRYDTCPNYRYGCDVKLDMLTLPRTNTIQVIDSTGNPVAQSSIFYSPNYADINFQNLNTSAGPFVKVRLSQGGTAFCKQITIHKLAGIPEVGPCI